jgi:hypothetical protein
MRLSALDSGHTLKTRLMFALVRVLSGHRAPDVVKTLRYRPEYFGGSMSPVFQSAMRGPSEWSVGERELMAAFVSRTNSCEF